MGYLKNKNALITGSSSGIGADIALAFAKEGCNVGLTYNRNKEKAEIILKKCEEVGVKAVLYKVELSNPQEVFHLMESFLEDFKTIDVLVNNAGGALKIPAGEFEDIPFEYWNSQINLNLNAAAYCAQYAVRNMKQLGLICSLRL